MKALSVFSAFTVLGLSALADPLYVEDFDYDGLREQELDRLADEMQQHIDIELLLKQDA